MDTKKVLALSAVALVVIAGGFTLYLQRDEILNGAQKISGNKSQNSPEITIEKKTITDATKPFNINISYPYIAGLEDFNLKVDQVISTLLESFKKNSLENDEAVKKVDPISYAKYPRQYDFMALYDVGQADNNVISVVFEIYAFEGGAHGGTNFYPLNYDVKNKKEITIAELFKNQADYISKISAYCKSDLEKQIQNRLGSLEGSWIDQGTEPKKENFSIFRINQDNTLTFYFPQYQVAPYAAGDFKVTMPR